MFILFSHLSFVYFNFYSNFIRDEELATEVAWVVVYLTALSNVATSMLAKSDLLQILVDRLESSNSLQLLIPVMGNTSRLYALQIRCICITIIPSF